MRGPADAALGGVFEGIYTVALMSISRDRRQQSLSSVNACFTHMTAIREGDGVRYYGDAIPEMVFVDYDLMRSAPAYLLRGGIGDVLSCHTGRWDWEYAVKRGHTPAWDDFAASESLRFIKELRELAPGLYKGENEAIKRGLDTRCGLEDMLTLPDGSSAADNAAIITAARRKVEQSGRQV